MPKERGEYFYDTKCYIVMKVKRKGADKQHPVINSVEPKGSPS